VTRSLARRLAFRLLAVPVGAALASVVMFAALHLLPGDPVARETHQSPEQYRRALHALGLDQPLPFQYLQLMGRILNGDLARRLQPEATTTAELAFLAAAVALCLGVAVGAFAAANQGSWRDRAAIGSSLLVVSVPSFVWAAILVLFFVTGVYTLSGGLFAYDVGPCCRPDQIWLPVLALGLPYVGYVARHTRAAMLEVARQDYVMAARAKGLQESAVMRRHVFRNAALVLMTVATPELTRLLVGSLVIEQVFSVPGLGHELIGSILSRSYDTAVGVLVYYSILIGLANLLVDLTYPLLDPRIRL
jgi:ABC-type dipeptide/oligopeptide/nickel transport system permease component